MRRFFFPHIELMSVEAPEIIMAKVKKFEELKEEYHNINMRRFELEKMIEEEEKELNSIRGVLYDYTDEPEEKQACPVEKINLLLQGVSNSKF